MTVLTREAAVAVVESGQTPIHVMHDNMCFFHERALELSGDLQGMIEAARTADVIDAETLAKMIKKFEKAKAARLLAEQCAVDLGPYVHARLASITVSGPNGGPIPIIYDEVESGF